MKNRILILFFLLSGSGFAQVDSQSLRNLFNEFHVSVNHGFNSPKTYFGAGLGASHLFHPDRALGARVGLELDHYHFWRDNNPSPENKYQSRFNQHFNAVNITIPVNLQVNFGYSVRSLFEMGFHLGVNIHTGYKADAVHSASVPYTEEHIDTKIGLGALGGFNMGIGVRLPFNDAVSLLIKPGIGANIYFSDGSGYNNGMLSHAYAKLSIGILLLNYSE